VPSEYIAANLNDSNEVNNITIPVQEPIIEPKGRISTQKSIKDGSQMRYIKPSAIEAIAIYSQGNPGSAT